MYLDAYFVEGSGHLDLDIETEHRLVVKGWTKTLIGKRSPLEFFVSTEPYHRDVTFDRNLQGLPTKGHHCSIWNCRTNMPGTMDFISPRIDCIARYSFENISGLLFDCGSPRNSTPEKEPKYVDIKKDARDFGVLACVDEGVLKRRVKERASENVLEDKIHGA